MWFTGPVPYRSPVRVEGGWARWGLGEVKPDLSFIWFLCGLTKTHLNKRAVGARIAPEQRRGAT